MIKDMNGNILEVGDKIMVMIQGVQKATITKINEGGIAVKIPGTNQVVQTAPAVTFVLDELQSPIQPNTPMMAWKAYLPPEERNKPDNNEGSKKDVQ